MFRELCISLHQGKEQPDTQYQAQYQAIPRPDELQDSRNVGIPRMNLDTEETHETHNLYIEKTRGSLKNINFVLYQ